MGEMRIALGLRYCNISFHRILILTTTSTYRVDILVVSLKIYIHHTTLQNCNHQFCVKCWMYSHAWTSSLRWASSFNPQSTTCPDPALVNKPLVTFHSELRHHLNPLWDRSAEGKVTPTRIGVRRFDILVKVKEYVIWIMNGFVRLP